MNIRQLARFWKGARGCPKREGESVALVSTAELVSLVAIALLSIQLFVGLADYTMRYNAPLSELIRERITPPRPIGFFVLLCIVLYLVIGFSKDFSITIIGVTYHASEAKSAILIILISSLGVAVGSAILSRMFSTIGRDVMGSEDDFAGIYLRVRRLEENTHLAGAINIESQEKLVGELAERIKGVAIDQHVVEQTKALAANYEKLWQVEQFEKATKATRDRLLQQVSALGDRTNLNLGIGLSLAIAGVAILMALVLFGIERDKGFERFAIDFLPRISLVLLIEVFSYFFLRLYKQGIDEIRYFQNEVTNSEMKLLAVLVAQRFAPDKVEGVISSLVATERNFLVPKDQRLVAEAVEAQAETAMQRYMTMLREFVPGRAAASDGSGKSKGP